MLGTGVLLSHPFSAAAAACCADGRRAPARAVHCAGILHVLMHHEGLVAAYRQDILRSLE